MAKGLLGGLGAVLFGDAGQSSFEPDPFMVKGSHQIDTEAFRYDPMDYGSKSQRKAGRELDRVMTEGTPAPQLGIRKGKASVSEFTPEAYGGATIDRTGFGEQMARVGNAQTQAGQAREQLATDLGLTRDAALGLIPSVAEQQLKEGMERQIAAQASAAASARGGAGAQAAARRRAAMQGAQTQAETNRAAATLRADEMAKARGELLAGGEALRAGDIGQQDVMLSAADLALRPDIQQAMLEQEAGIQGAGLAAEAGMQRVGLETEAGMQARDIQSRTDLANLDAALRSRGMQNQYSLGLLGHMGELEKSQLGAQMGLQGLLSQAGQEQRQRELAQWQAEQNLRAGVAAQNAQTDLVTGSGGLGFFGPMLSGFFGQD